MMKRLSKRETIILALTIALVLIFVAWRFVFGPVFEGGNTIEPLLLVQQKKLAKTKQMLATAKDAERQYARLAKAIGISGAEGVESSAFLSTVETAANEANVRVLNMQPKPPQRQKLFKFFGVELQVSGTLNAIASFMYALQAAPNNFFINELSLEKNADGSAVINGRVVISKMRLLEAENP